MRSFDRRRPRHPWSPAAVSAGFTLVEVMVALLITMIAVVGLASSFGLGRGLIDRYATGRDALGVAERRMETLRMKARHDLGDPDLTVGAHGPNPVALSTFITGSEAWNVVWVDDPGDLTGGADTDGNTDDYKLVTVTVTWTQAGITDHVDLKTRVLAP